VPVERRPRLDLSRVEARRLDLSPISFDVRQLVSDVILMDIQMPEMDGLQAAAAIRALGPDSPERIPIIALTAHAQPGFDQVCIAAGMDSYLIKPIDSTKLRELLADIPVAGTGAEHCRDQ